MSKKIFFSLLFSFFLFTASVTPSAVFAQLCDPPGGPVEGGVSTPFGCLPYESKAFINVIVGWGAVVAGVIAFLFLVYAGFLIMTASGDPKKVKAGQEIATAAISGLVLIVLAVVIINFFGFNVLGLPTFVNNPNI